MKDAGAYLGRVDMTSAERLFGLPMAIPVSAEHNINGTTPSLVDGTVTLAAFHAPGCSCGRPFGICYDPAAIADAGQDTNEVLLHELTHAWQFFVDPGGCAAQHLAELDEYGYWDAPFEVEARFVAESLNRAGVQVWFPG